MFDARLQIKKPSSNYFFIGYEEKVNIVEEYDK
jgi:hypothetical protein